MRLFDKYNLWSFFSILIHFLLRDFRIKLSDSIGEKVAVKILKDRKNRLDELKKTSWILLKNNIQSSINAKLRFLIAKDEYNILTKSLNHNKFEEAFNTIIIKLKKITGMNELETFSTSNIFDPERLGHSNKYYAVNILLFIKNTAYNLFFIIRDEILFFPFIKVKTDFLLKLDKKFYKKAFIELDKKIIWDGMKLWGNVLKNKMEPFTKDFPEYKYKLYPKEDKAAYSMFIQYLFILKLLSRDINI